MQTGALTQYVDVAQVTLYVFWFFFAGLIVYLHRENKREGYPLVSERGNARVKIQGFPAVPRRKTFYLPHGHKMTVPREEVEPAIAASPIGLWPGAPLEPTGNPLVDAVGPASYSMRANEPDLGYDDGLPKLMPLRVATDWWVAEEDPDPRGFSVVAADGKVAGTVTDVWIDRAETMLRYVEVAVPTASGTRLVLVPAMLARFDGERREVKVVSVMAHHFADAPTLANPDVVTLREEDRVSAYFGGGHLYAHPDRLGPIL